MDDDIQRAFENGESMLIHVRNGELQWRRLLGNYTGSIEMHFSQGSLSGDVYATDIEDVQAGAPGREVDLREG